MAFHARVAAISFAVLGLSAAPVFAANCELQIVNKLDLTPLGTGGRMLVPVTINGEPKFMMLATAGGITSLYQSAVDELKLHPLDSAVKLLSSSGNVSNRYVHLDKFQIGYMKADGINLMVAADTGGKSDPPVDGALTGDMMSHYDIEMDFAGRKLNFYSTDHCPGQVISWQASAVAVVPFSLNRPVKEQPEARGLRDTRDTHIRVPVTLDGKSFMAVINTAATDSTMSAKVAKYVFDVTADSPGSTPLGTPANDPNQKIFGRVFKSLDFDGVAVTNPHVIVFPDLVGAKDPDNAFTTGSHIKRDDDNFSTELTIGMDVLKHLHLYVAYGEKKLYITPASAPAPAATAAQQ